MNTIYIGYKKAMLTVIGPKKENGRWPCKCECGNEKDILAVNLSPTTSQKSCGCLLRKKTQDLVGKRFGNLLVLEMTNEISNDGCVLVKCQCDCGREKNMDSHGIKKGTIVSCGCKYWKWNGHKEINVDYWHRTITSAKTRGIKFSLTIEEAWNQAVKQDFKCAYTGIKLVFSRKRSERTCSLDRIDSEKGYTIDNIQWIYRPLNFMKSNFKEEDFLNYVKAIYEFKGLNNGKRK